MDWKCEKINSPKSDGGRVSTKIFKFFSSKNAPIPLISEAVVKRKWEKSRSKWIGWNKFGIPDPQTSFFRNFSENLPHKFIYNRNLYCLKGICVKDIDFAESYETEKIRIM